MKSTKKSGVDSKKVLKTFREVSQAAKDNLKQSLALSKLNITAGDMNMIYQLIDSSLDNAWSNSEKSLMRLLEDVK
jgi:exonuclease III